MPPQPIRRRKVFDFVAKLPEILFWHQQRKVVLGGCSTVCFSEMFAVVQGNIAHPLVNIFESRQVNEHFFHYIFIS